MLQSSHTYRSSSLGSTEYDQRALFPTIRRPGMTREPRSFDDSYRAPAPSTPFPEFDDELEAEEIALSLPEEGLRFLRDFILGAAMYVEELESAVGSYSDEYWEAREHAYRIITGMLIDTYQYQFEG